MLGTSNHPGGAAAQISADPSDARDMFGKRTPEAIQALFGVRYFDPGVTETWVSPDTEHYHYTCYIGAHSIVVEKGDSVFYLTDIENDEPTWAHCKVGPTKIKSERFAVVMRGYKPEPRSARMATKNPVLPYVNGCSTSEVFPPPRLGDPTLQRLLIPAHSAEQAHHIHSTVRAVYVLRGRGVSIVGMEGESVTTELVPGMVCILDPMCPHHFETPQGEAIEVIPFHVFSAVPGENNHPMMRGTFLMNQGA